MSKRILAIIVIYACTAVGWIILAGAMVVRTETQDGKLRGAVRQLWGSEQTQKAPSAYYEPTKTDERVRAKEAREYIALEASDVRVDVKLDHRKKGLLWYSTYGVDFSGEYRVKNNSGEGREMVVTFAFPAEGAVYDDFSFIVGKREAEDIELESGRISKGFRLGPGESEQIRISYKSQGLDKWSYDFGNNVKQVKNFSLVLNTDFEGIDFPEGSISPTTKELSGDGWRLGWEYSSLLTGVAIGVIMPHKLNPGPWVSRVTTAAPVSLFLFFFLLFIFTTVKKIKLHPMNYFFVGAAFFSFHLLLAYLVDHISIHTAFWICSAVSIFLVVSYMRLVVGKRFAFVEIALWQLVYLVFFSYTFFFEGYTGLAITILCICTLFVVMQFTGKVDWDRVFAGSEEPGKTEGLR
jgi:inner membrane protein involved in colicin E2 resistance